MPDKPKENETEFAGPTGGMDEFLNQGGEEALEVEFGDAENNDAAAEVLGSDPDDQIATLTPQPGQTKIPRKGDDGAHRPETASDATMDDVLEEIDDE